MYERCVVRDFGPLSLQMLATQAGRAGSIHNGGDNMVSHPIQDIRRQIGKRERNCDERIVQLQKLWSAEKEACQHGLEGRLRFDLLKHRAGFSEQTDDSQIRRMLREAQRLFARKRSSKKAFTPAASR